MPGLNSPSWVGKRPTFMPYPPTLRALWLAEDLLSRLACLSRAVKDGGQVSELHLAALQHDVLCLLDEVGGFEEVAAPYRDAD